MILDSLQQTILNDHQRGFALTSIPFTDIAHKNNTDTATILNNISYLVGKGYITRVGPVFRPNTIGVSTLAAMKIPTNMLTSVAELVSQYREINHNYERDHEFNLWFVATAPDQQHLEAILQDIEENTGYDVMRLPLLKEFHIDLGFKMPLQQGSQSTILEKHQSSPLIIKHSTLPNDLLQQQLIAEIQLGLPLVERPYAEIAGKLSIKESEVIRRIDIMLTAGVIRRMGVVVRHRELGYKANAMLVWDIKDDKINELGKQLSKESCITLCYQRPRHLPQWPYSLFTMIHGKDEHTVEQCIENIVEKYQLSEIPRATLFSKRRFKQRGACYNRIANSHQPQYKTATYD